MVLQRLKSFHYSKNYPQYAFYKAVISAWHQLNIPRDKKYHVADLPCGHGEFTYNLASNKLLDIDAFDISVPYIAHAQTYFQRENINYIIADVEDALTTREKQYDFIFVINSLFLLPHHELFLRACHESLKQVGKFFVVIPNTSSDNFKEFQRLDPTLNVLTTSKEETVSYISTFGFRPLLNKDLVFASFYKRRELKLLGPLSNLYLISLNKVYSAFKLGEPAYHLLVFEK